MFPIVLNLSQIPVLLVGRGELLVRRRKQLEEGGAARLVIKETPSQEDIQDAAVVMVAGLPRAEAERIVQQARGLGKLVNVEDVNDLCDFYFTANVRRGDLLIAISTGGASPTLARKIRDAIGAMFGEEWAARVRDMARERRAWKAAGATFHQLIDNSEKYLKEKGWFTDEDKAA